MKALPSIRESLVNIANFSGRQSRDRFWPYALIVFVVGIGVAMVAATPAFMSSFARMQQFAIDHPDQATVHRGFGQHSITIRGYHPELMPDSKYLLTVTIVIGAASTLLYAAAVVRRLHDTGRSGFWGLLPLLFVPLPFILLPRFFGDDIPDLIWFLPLFVNNLLYLGASIFLIYLLTRDSEPGENRYGPQPLA